MNVDYEYDLEIREGDPIATPPTSITLSLKPHQMASLHKAILFEKYGRVNYYVENPNDYYDNDDISLIHLYEEYNRRHFQYKNHYKVTTNIGVLGDIVGYGKTLVALSIIASVPTREIHRNSTIVHSYNGSLSKANIQVECDMAPVNNERTLFETTLIVVPRGPVYTQWKNALEANTKLNYFSIDDLSCIKKKCPPQGSSHDVLKAFFEKYDSVLIKNTTLQTMLTYYNNNPYVPSPILGYARIMIDEAPDIISKTLLMEFRFMWFITATYKQMIGQYYRSSSLGIAMKEILTSRERMNAIMVKCQKEFVMKSFIVPSYKTQIHRCIMPRYMTIIQPFLTDNIIQLVNANDISGAIRELGGTTETEDNIVGLVSKKIERDIFNKEREKQYVEGLDMDQSMKDNRLRLLDDDLAKLRKKKLDLEERISTITKDGCSICYNELDSPILLSCTHIFCGQCILKWIEVNEASENLRINKVCPTCRQPIHKDKLIGIVKKKESNKQPKKEGMTKLEKVIDIISSKSDGRFLVFSQYDSTFKEIRDELKARDITSCELKGSTSVMLNHLENFKKGIIRVILLNTHYAGSGIDISCATDVILFHHMGEVSKQAIGRAQRVGRSSPLTVHKLYYPHEEVGMISNQ